MNPGRFQRPFLAYSSEPANLAEESEELHPIREKLHTSAEI